MKLVKLFIVTFAIIFVSCKEDIVSPTLSEDDQVREAVFRYQFGSTVHDSLFLFIGIGLMNSTKRITSYVDPSNDLLSKFSNHNPPVKPFSASYPRNAGYCDIETNKYGIRFHVDFIESGSPGQVHAYGGFFISVDNAEERLFFLHKTYNYWMVDSTWLFFVS